jgi:alpha-tubulin suppressor-like RCC1 family protein
LFVEPPELVEPSPEDPVQVTEHPWYIDVDWKARLSCGWAHSVFMRPDDTAFALGLNAMFQLDVPPDVVFNNVMGSFVNSGGIDENGLLHFWGYNIMHLVDGSPNGTDDCKVVDAGSHHGMLLKNTGEIIGWVGEAPEDDMDTTYNTAPLTNMPVYTAPPVGEELDPKFVDISCGAKHTVGLMSDGTVHTWGVYADANEYTTPADNNFVQIDANGTSALALTDEGKVVHWGVAFGGTPPSGNNWRVVGCGSQFGVALHKDGFIYAWGNDEENQVSGAPIGEAWAETKFVHVAVGKAHAIAIKADGTMVAWGKNEYGETAVDASYSMIPNSYVPPEEPAP